jgi:hypothetical protein
LSKAEKVGIHKDELIERLKKENRYLRSKDRRIEQDYNLLKSDHELLEIKFEELQKENESLKLFQDYRG